MDRADLPAIGILVGTRGRGSNMVALADACSQGSLQARVGLVVAPSIDSPALARAEDMGLKTRVVDVRSDLDGETLTQAFKEQECLIVCLAGFMRLVPIGFLRAFPNMVLNIHPALLPRHGGKGMYGHHVHEAVLKAGDTEGGCSVHFVNERYDEGEVILQKRCPVLPTDTPETLAQRVLALEHQAYPEAVRLVLDRLRQ